MKTGDEDPKKVLVDNAIDDYIRPKAALESEKFFGARNAISQDTLILHKEKINKDLELIREKYDIPKLNLYEDLISRDISNGGSDTVCVSSSFFLDTLDSKKGNGVRTDIEKMIRKYELPISFYDWFEYWLLYQEEPDWNVLWHTDVALLAIENPKTLKNICLTAAEKKFIKLKVRDFLKIKTGRPPLKIRKKYTEILKYLGKSKNQKRRRPALRDSLRIAFELKSGKKFTEIIGNDFGSERMEREKRDIEMYKKRVQRLKAEN